MKIDDQYSVFEGSRRDFVLACETTPLLAMDSPHAHRVRWRVGNKSDRGKCVCLLLLMMGISLFLMVMCGILMAMYAWQPPVSTRQEEWITIAPDEYPDATVFTRSSSSQPLYFSRLVEEIPTVSSVEEHSSLFDLFYDDVLSSSGNSHTRPPPTFSWSTWQEEGMVTVSSMEEDYSLFNHFHDDVWISSPIVSSMEEYSSLFDLFSFDVLSFSDEGLYFCGNAHTRPPPTLISPTWLEARMPTVSPMEKRWRLTVSCGDVLSSSGNSLTRPPSIENSNPYRAEIPEIILRGNADAEHEKDTLIFSLPFYSDHNGYKMCIWAYIVGMVWVPTSRWKYRFILLEWGWYFEKH